MIQLWILAFCLCNTRFSLLYSMERILPLILVVVLRSSLPGIARYRRPGDCMKLFWSLFFIFCQNLSSLDKALIEKPMLVQVGSFSAAPQICHLEPLCNKIS